MPRVIATVLGVVALGAVIAAGAALVYVHLNVERLPVDPGDRPTALDAVADDYRYTGPTVLVVGLREGELADAGIVILREDAAPAAIAFPPELTVEVPGVGPAPLRAAHEQGRGAMIDAVVAYTGIPIEHLVVVRLDGLPALAGTVGAEPCLDVDLAVGTAEAITTLRRPLRAKRAFDAASDAIAVDGRVGTLTALRAVRALRDADPADVELVAVPAREHEGEVRAHVEPAETLFQAVRTGRRLPSPEALDAPTTRPEDVTVEVLNGTTVPGLAGDTATALEEVGFAVAEVGNAETDEVERTEVRHVPGDEETAALVSAHLPGSQLVAAVDGSGEEVVVVLGDDWAEDPTLAEVDLGQPVVASVPADGGCR